MCLTVTLASLVFCCTTQHSVLKCNVLKICLDLACFSLLSLLPSVLRFKRKNTVWMSQNPCCNFRTAEERRIISMQFSLYSKKHMVYKPFFILQNTWGWQKDDRIFIFGWAIAMKETEDVNSDKRNQLSAVFNPSVLSLESWEQWPLLLVMVFTLRHRPIKQRWTAIEH